MLIRSWIPQKLGFLIVEVNIFYDFETFSNFSNLEFAFEFSFKSSEMVRLTTLISGTMSTLIWAMFGSDSVSKIGVHCLTLAVQSVDSQYSAGDTLDN